MNIRELIEALEDYAQEWGDETEVRLAMQPHYPFEHSLAKVVVAQARDIDTSELEDLEGEVCAMERDKRECPDQWTDEDAAEMKKYEDRIMEIEEQMKESAFHVYLGEGSQIGYLPGPAASELGWK